MNVFGLQGKTILVTGASSGIGRSIAICCSQQGANVVLTGRSITRLEETKSLLSGADSKIVPFDLLDIDSLDTFISQLPKLDGVVLCAGIIQTVPVKFISSDTLSDVMNINACAPMMLVQKLVRSNLVSRNGSIVFISSIASVHARVGNSIYSASKGAIDSFARCLALELSYQKIRVNTIMPGLIRTGISDSNVIDDDDLNKEESEYPLGPGSVEDVANGVIYLLSEASRWVTGTSLRIDGGITLR